MTTKRKRTLVLLVCVLATTVYAAELPTSEEPLAFTDVVKVDDVSASELYMRAKLWFAASFVDSKNVLEVEDKDAGILVGKGAISYEPVVYQASTLVRGRIQFEVRVLVKDGRYKYSLSDFRHHGSRSTAYGPIDFGLITDAATCPKVSGNTKRARAKTWIHLKAVTESESKLLIHSLKMRMTKPVGGDDDW